MIAMNVNRENQRIKVRDVEFLEPFLDYAGNTGSIHIHFSHEVGVEVISLVTVLGVISHSSVVFLLQHIHGRVDYFTWQPPAAE